jgi:hypothetical protein
MVRRPLIAKGRALPPREGGLSLEGGWPYEELIELILELADQALPLDPIAAKARKHCHEVGPVDARHPSVLVAPSKEELAPLKLIVAFRATHREQNSLQVPRLAAILVAPSGQSAAAARDAAEMAVRRLARVGLSRDVLGGERASCVHVRARLVR